MFKKTLASLVLAFSFLLMPPASADTTAPKTTCSFSHTTTEFMRRMADIYPTIMILKVNPDATEKVVTYLSKDKNIAFDADAVYLGVWDKDKQVGIAMFKDDCIIPSGTFVYTFQEHDKMVNAINLLWMELTLLKQV